MLKKFLKRLKLKYDDPQEEQEYNQVRFPFVNRFIEVVYITLTLVLVFFVARYFKRNISPQNYIMLGLIVGALFLFLFRRWYRRYLEIVLMVYLTAVCVILITVSRSLVADDSVEGFWMGYSFAMVQRLLGYRVVKMEWFILLYVVTIALKFPVLPYSGTFLNLIVVVLDLGTIFLAFKSEEQDRSMFDSLFKSKKDILKFKHLLTQYLPIQMAIFSNDFTKTFYINNAFRRTFKITKKDQTRTILLEKMVIEKEAIEKEKTLFTSLGYNTSKEDDAPLTLARFMSILSNNFDSLREIGHISFPVIEDEPKPENPMVLEASALRENSQNHHGGGALSAREKQGGVSKEITKTGLNSTTKASKSQGKEGDLEVGHHNSSKSNDKQSIKSGSSDIVYEEGVKRVFKVKVFPLLWDETEAIAMVLDDITQQRIITELKQADKNKDMVIAMVSHELRTPLNAMLGLIDIAKKNICHLETLSYLTACRNSGVLLLSLVNSILDMNQISHKKLNLVYAKISIPELLEEMKSLFDYNCKLKKLYLETEVDADVPEFICTDKNRLSQILINLLGNAFKFTFSGGVTIKIKLETLSPLKVKLTVTDTGIGIKKEDQERLFKMYGRLEQQDKKINTNGVGLGLTISSSLVRLLNPSGNGGSGGIQVESEVDIGTSFSFSIESQSTEPSKGKDLATSSLADISSRLLTEEKETAMLKKTGVYTINNNENYAKMTSSTQNIDTIKRIDVKTLDLEQLKESGDDAENSDSQRLLLGDKKKNQLIELPEEVARKSSQSPESYTKTKPLFKRDTTKELESHRRWCLVVDDNPFNLMVACHIMEERKFQVKTALNGQEAIKQAVDHAKNGLHFDVILMDCQMPVMDGYQATRILKSMMVNKEISVSPVIALTANNHDEDHEKLCNEVGMDGYVAKPLQISELETVLKRVRKLVG